MSIRFVFASAFALLACGGAPEPWNATSEAISGGEPAPDQSSVVAVVNFAGGQCSGSLIAPRLVLTARHCVADTADEDPRVLCGRTPWVAPDSAGALFVVPLPEISEDPDDYLAVSALSLSDPPDSDLCGTDVVLLVLERPLAGVTPLTPRLDAPALAGEAYTAVGYGMDESLTDTPSGTRKQLGEREVICAGNECGTDVRDNEWVGTEGPCRGDSGGPALDAEGRVFGVLSRGQEGCTEPVYGGIASRAEWLRSQAVAAAGDGESPPEWACAGSSVCEEPQSEESGCAVSRSARGHAWISAVIALLAWRLRRRPHLTK